MIVMIYVLTIQIKHEPGTCGCGIADSDSDEDGTLDCMDSNDDDDGLPDGEEQGPDRNNQNYDGNGDGIRRSSARQCSFISHF